MTLWGNYSVVRTSLVLSGAGILLFICASRCLSIQGVKIRVAIPINAVQYSVSRLTEFSSPATPGGRCYCNTDEVLNLFRGSIPGLAIRYELSRGLILVVIRCVLYSS